MFALNRFLSGIPDVTRLSEIIVPGSHDAGVYTEAATRKGLARKRWAICQSDNLFGQCNLGSRFFDLRILQDGKEHRAHHTTMGMGALGGKLKDMMGQLGDFITANPSEFVIARFTKCKGHEAIVKTVKDYLGHLLYRGGCAIAGVPIEVLRGKVIAVFGSDEFSAYLDPGEGIHAFYKTANLAHGLSVVGKYSNTSDAKKMLKSQTGALKGYFFDNNVSLGQHYLYQMYWTQTFFLKNIKKNTESKNGVHELAKTGHIKGASVAAGALPNIVLYDFLNSEVSQNIIALNPSLNLVSARSNSAPELWRSLGNQQQQRSADYQWRRRSI